MKKIFFLFITFALISACSSQAGEKNKTAGKDLPTVTVDEFFSNPSAYVDREINISGLVTHVCKHGGQKLFLAGTSGPQTIRINTGGNIPEFGIEMEGNRVRFIGTVRLMNDEFIAAANAEEETHHPATNGADSPEQVANRNKEYYIVANRFETVD